MTKQAIGYIRVSTTKQAEEGYSLEAQESKIIAWCAYNGYQLVDIKKDEGYSAKDMKKRDGLEAALNEISNGMALVCYKLDRITRSIKDLIHITETLVKREAHIVSITEDIDTTSPMGRFIYHLLGILGQLEREIIGERTRMGMQTKKAKGEYTGGKLPLGYILDEDKIKLKENPAELELVNMVKELRKNGSTLTKISKKLAQNGFHNREGKPFHIYQISRILGEAN
jgi:site-specific DNA recombinase